MSGTLLCRGCEGRYPVTRGVPRFGAPGNGEPPASTIGRTESAYGYLWRQSNVSDDGHRLGPYHYDKMERSLRLRPARGLVLDAGCGEGIDLVNQGHQPGVEVVGVELSYGGCQTSFTRSIRLPTVHVVQADLRELPFADHRFDFIYAYGVLHHLSVPREGLAQLVRVAKPGVHVAAYLYEDFSDRPVGWQWLLLMANQFRRVTAHLPHRLLYALCQVGSPVTFLCFALPFHVIRCVPGLAGFAQTIPFRHARGPFSLAGDLYDRFAAPIEWRYSREESETFFRREGLMDVGSTRERGWMVQGVKP